MRLDVNPEGVEFEEADEGHLDAEDERDRLTQAVVSATDWTTETILNQLQRNNIDLNPRFQRRDAWTLARKSRFIESLILNLPVPQIVLAERKGVKGQHIVLDGKQRLLSLLQFTGSAAGRHNAFALEDLEVLTELNGLTFDQIRDAANTRERYNAFLNQTVRSVVIKNWPDVTFLHLVFLRLNTGSVTLSPQELRQAMFPGGFSDFVDDAAIKSTALKKLLRLEEPDFRMRDVEVLVRFIAFENFLHDYRGSLKSFLDDACETLNKQWGKVSSVVERQVTDFESAALALMQIFGPANVARRPESERRRPFNRAIFDVQVHYLTDKRVRTAALKRKASVRSAFERLWVRDPDFVRSVETTTKSLEATYKRFSAWGEALAKAAGVKVQIPKLREGRIEL